ncbi:MAG: nitroreductase family protein [SAR202 cluster bacterium]|nr:nitroreductase family protein [SAR202 cluster bacterium]|tara:strand:+ start:49530 stop:50210 length:681 start_codon:yes stop_codon:yes gene_type:complete
MEDKVNAKLIPLPNAKHLSDEEMKSRSEEFYRHIKQRRTVRDFSPEKVSRSIIDNCILAAGTAPSGANMQPWHFAVSGQGEARKIIREKAEKEERDFYETKASAEWLKALEALGTDANKPFLETAPFLIGIFVKSYGILPDGSQVKHYYAIESVGIATGILIAALHNAGLSTLTHTPSPMGFLNKIFKRPKNERPFLLLVAGYAEKGAQVPDIQKMSLGEISSDIS